MNKETNINRTNLIKPDKIWDTVTIIGEKRNFHDEKLLVTKKFVQIGKQHFEYEDLFEIIDCIEHEKNLWILLTKRGTVNIKSSSPEAKDEIIAYIRSNRLF